jgi:glycosyltransferase involved in cell wall biosynthesis
MKKVVLFMFDLGLGGTEKVMVNLANYLNKNNFKVEILTISNISTHLSDDIDKGIEVKSLNASRILFSFPRLVRYVKNNSLDIFVANVWPLTCLAASCCFFKKNFTKKLILVEHCHLGREFADKSFLFKILQKISIKVLYPFSKKVIAVSQGVKDDLVKNKSIKDSQVLVIMNPVNCENINKQRNNPAIKHWQTFEYAKLISVGNFKPQKNYSYLIQILRILKDRGFLFKQLIVGDGSEMQKIEHQISKENLSDDVILAGSIPQPLDLVQQSDLFILPSSFEGFGLVIVEALSVGTTVVSTDCFSGPSEILQNGKLGYLAKTDDAASFADLIEIAFSNKFSPDILKLRSQDFKIEKIGPKYIELFKS